MIGIDSIVKHFLIILSTVTLHYTERAVSVVPVLIILAIFFFKHAANVSCIINLTSECLTLELLCSTCTFTHASLSFHLSAFQTMIFHIIGQIK
jgi:hypothetical protein